MSTATQPSILERFGAAFLRLTALVGDASEDQWRVGRSPVPKEDTTERSKGMTNDPTANAVLDPRRVALRAAVLEAEAALDSAGRALQLAERTLALAHAKWQG